MGLGRADGVNRADGSAGVRDVLTNAIKVMYEPVAHPAIQMSLRSFRTKELNTSETNLSSVCSGDGFSVGIY
jgi:hypothetical protein